jgi:hypothetical protein
MAICPLLSMGKADPEKENPQLVECQEEKCEWWLRRHFGAEVYTCAITALAIYNLRKD